MNENRSPTFGILLVDDEPAWLKSLSLILLRHIKKCTQTIEFITNKCYKGCARSINHQEEKCTA